MFINKVINIYIHAANSQEEDPEVTSLTILLIAVLGCYVLMIIKTWRNHHNAADTPYII